MFKSVPMIVVLLYGFASAEKGSANHESGAWQFAVSGDSRNCGDVVMPGLAAEARKHNIDFYWHLGDLRAIRGPDQDFIRERAHQGKPANLAEYEQEAWDDFIENQIQPWGDVPFYLGIGNHELAPPKNRAQFINKFHDYLDRPELREQRLKDDPRAIRPKAYYHWLRGGVDFIYLDNASKEQFDAAQMNWLRTVVERDRNDISIGTLVVGMHKALPESISVDHSMNESAAGTESGRQVYEMLLTLRNQAHKLVYLLASHSHYFMDGVFNTPYWNSHGGVLPGWIIGTAGAERLPLPAAASHARFAKTNIYGYLLATVHPAGGLPGSIEFRFEELPEALIPPEVIKRFTPNLVDECFAGNRRYSSLE